MWVFLCSQSHNSVMAMRLINNMLMMCLMLKMVLGISLMWRRVDSHVDREIMGHDHCIR